jgi:AAA+ ATPase superfamily predicted ATPase
MGRYWDKNIEIDIIAEDPFEQQVSFIECKWNKNVSIDRTLYRLKRNADLLQHYAGWKKLYFIMSRTGISHPNHIRYDQI